MRAWYLGLFVAGCHEVAIPVVEGPAPLERVTPVYGGTMAADDTHVVAADPSRDLVVFAPSRDMVFDFEATVVQLSEGAEPFRVALHENRAFVTLRGAGQVVAYDRRGTELARNDVCAHPRGVATDRNLVFVACAGGELVTLEAENLGVLVRHRLRPDLRDVVVDEDTLLVSRFRAAEVLRVDRSTGQTVETLRPAPVHGQQRSLLPRVAWRMIAHPDGGAVLLHQMHSTQLLSAAGEVDDDNAYAVTGLGPLVSTRLTWFTSDSGRESSTDFDTLHPAVDVAIEPDGRHLAVAGALRDGSGWGSFTLRAPWHTVGPLPDVQTSSEVLHDHSVASVALPRSRAVLTYLRGAGRLSSLETPLPEPAWFEPRLAQENLFHRPASASSGLACVSCHPEGQDDGHTWMFHDLGPRRTQNLAGGVRSRRTFHWDAGFASLDELMTDVFSARMGGRRLAAMEVAELGAWLDGISVVSASTDVDEATLARGAALFVDPKVGCADCHHGPQLADHEVHRFARRQTPTKTPSLLGIGTRAPYMHTGCAETVLQRLTDVTCGGERHGDVVGLPESDLHALAAFVETL